MDVRTTATGPRARTIVTAATALAALFVLLVAAGAAAASGSAAPRRSATFSEPVYPGSSPARAALAAPRPGSGGWYWPVGTESFNGWSGWLVPRGSYVHVAQDMPCAAGRPVYAVGAGVVYISRAAAGGYGVGGAPGGCIIITHTTAAGTKFHALYGHVSRLKVKAGQRVTAGQVIAVVNGCRHLHFSIHPGSRYRDGNPYAGHVPKSWADHGGFVDPVKFLKTNPRSASYRPPALPWQQIVTQTAPFGYGAADGAAYWSEEGGAGSIAWREDLVSGERATLAAGVEAPAYDAARYATAPLEAPAIGFAVADRRPVLTLRAVHDTPAWGDDAELQALLTSSGGVPLRGGILKLQRSVDGRWTNVRLDVTDAAGAATFLYRPSATTALRAVFAPPASQPSGREYLTARSREQAVTPHVGLTTPKAPPVIDEEDLLTVAGDLTPRHTTGERTVQLVFQRRGDGGGWVSARTAPAVNRVRKGSPATRYVGHARLSPGSWRVRAVHPADELHAETVSAWRTFTVR